MERLRGSVIIPSWNTRELLRRCLDSLATQDLPGGFETIVVDNASTDGTDQLLRERADRVTALTNERNVGFAAANNQAAREARGRILFFLNSDTELLAPDTLRRLAEAVEQPDVGVAGPLLVNTDGSLQPSCAAHPSVSRALLVGAGLHRLLPDRLRAHWSPDTWSHDRSRDVPWVKGAAIAVRADAFRDIGGFWPTMYGEEQDLAYEARRRGLRVRFERSARILHVGNQANAQRYSDAVRGARVANAELVFLQKHYRPARAQAVRAITGAAYALRAVVHRILGHRPQASLYAVMAKAYAAGPDADRVE